SEAGYRGHRGPSFTVLSASAQPRCGGSKWRPDRQQQKGEADAGSHLDNPRVELQKAQANGVELGRGERVYLGDCITQGEISQHAAVCRISRIWLVSGLRQLVRSEASCALCNLIRFWAWPWAQ